MRSSVNINTTSLAPRQVTLVPFTHQRRPFIRLYDSNHWTGSRPNHSFLSILFVVTPYRKRTIATQQATLQLTTLNKKQASQSLHLHTNTHPKPPSKTKSITNNPKQKPKMQSFTKIIIALAATAGLTTAAPAKAIQTRQDTMAGDLTYYAPGLGACGVTSTEDDAVVALSWQLFDQYTPNGNPNLNTLCGKQIQINLNGASTVVTVADRCEACQLNDLDVPVKVFSQLADPDVGRVQMAWNWL